MTAKEIFIKTMPFCWMKLALGIVNLFIAVALFAILMGISVLFASEGVGAVMFIVWISLVGVVNFIINHYFGYLVKAGHVAVISEAFRSGRVPASPVSVGKEMVKERFGTANVYFIIDKLVTSSVKQLQRTLGRITDSIFGALPGADTLKSLTNLFLNISLGYIDECCLGYTFYQKEQNAYKSAADGVVIYAQNWKHLLKNAAKTALTVILSVVAVTLLAFIIFGAMFRLLGWSGFVAFVISLLFAWTVKYAFIDSWILVKMMSSYMQVAPSTVITFDLYGKLSKLSGKFKELFQRGSKESPKPDYGQQPVVGTKTGAEETANVISSVGEKQPSFCPSCGNLLIAGKPFCGKCGAKIG